MLSLKNLKIFFLLGIGIAFIYLAVLPPTIYSVDGHAMLAAAESLVTKHNFSVPPSMGTLGPDGNYYSHWYPLLSILDIPFVIMGLGLGNMLHLPGHYLAAVCSLLLPILLTAGTASFVFLLAIRLGSNHKNAYLVAVAFAFGTIVLVYWPFAHFKD